MADYNIVFLSSGQSVKLNPPGLGGLYVLTWTGARHAGPYTNDDDAVLEFAASNPGDRLFKDGRCIFPPSMVGHLAPSRAVTPALPQVQPKPKSPTPTRRTSRDDRER